VITQKTFRTLPHIVEAFCLPRLDEDVGGFLEWAARVEFDGYTSERDGCMCIETSAGQLTAEPGDWIVKAVTGEFLPFKPEAFRAAFIHSDAATVDALAASDTLGRAIAALPEKPTDAILSIIGGYPWDCQGNGNQANYLARYALLRQHLLTTGAGGCNADG
jgi:hypothetical protein